MHPLIGPIDAPGLHVMTFNVRRRMPASLRSADRWSGRAPLVRGLLQAERPALLAVQETLPDQVELLEDALGPSYVRLGQGRGSGGRGESTPLFYDAERLDLVGWTQRALSDRPEVSGSTDWGNTIPRIFVEAVLRDRATGSELLAIGTHLDVFSARSRRLSADAIRERVDAAGLPAIVLGDFNAAPGSVPWNGFTGGGTLVDAWESAEARLTPEWGTFGNYRRPRRGDRIDGILVTPDIRVERIGIHAEPETGPWPSDHYPVQAVLHLP